MEVVGFSANVSPKLLIIKNVVLESIPFCLLLFLFIYFLSARVASLFLPACFWLDCTSGKNKCTANISSYV